MTRYLVLSLFVGMTGVLAGCNSGLVALVLLLDDDGSSSRRKGNEAPVVEIISVDQDGSGTVRIETQIADSNADPTDLQVEYSVVVLAPGDDDFASAAIAESTTRLATSKGGTNHVLSWLSVNDLGRVDREVLLRITPTDQPGGKLEPARGETVTIAISLDNNSAPQVLLADEQTTGSDSDRRRGQIVRFEVIDAESDPVDVVIQWAHAGEPFPALPAIVATDAPERERLLHDPESAGVRRRLQIITVETRAVDGPVETPVVGLDDPGRDVLSSWIKTSAGGLGLRMHRSSGSLDQSALVGRRVELLSASRPSSFRRVCFYDTRTSIVRMTRAFDALPAAGDRLRIHLNDVSLLASSIDGVEHRVAWASDVDVPGGGEVQLRITPYDRVESVDEEISRCAATSGFPTANARTGDVGAAQVSAGNRDLHGPFSRGIGSTPPLEAVPDAVALATGDIDRDGLEDILVAGGSSRTLVLFFQNPSGSFDELRLLDARVGDITDAKLVDVDADGDLDIVLASQSFTTSAIPDTGIPAFDRPGGVFLFLQEPGFGGIPRPVPDVFTNRVRLTAGGDLSSPMALIAQDLDDDGDIDIAVANAAMGEPDIVVFLRDGLASSCDVEGEYGVCRADLAIGPAPGALSLAAGKVDDDGRTDLIAGHAGGFTLFSQAGNNTFEPQAMTSVDVNQVRSLGLIDLDQDGRLDVVGTDAETDGIFVAHQELPGEFVVSPARLFVKDGTAQQVLTADVDSNGTTDLMATFSFDIVTCLSDEEGRFSCEALRTLPDASGPSEPFVLGDVDGDGFRDLVFAAQTVPDVHVVLQDRRGRFAEPAGLLQTLQDGDAPDDIIAADFNVDGLPDLAVLSPSGEFIEILAQTDPNTFVSALTIRLDLLSVDGVVDIAAGDVNGDGFPDLVTANFDSGDVTVFEQVAETGLFSLRARLESDDLAGPQAVALGDINGDGRIDVAVAGRLSNNAVVFRQEESGSFGPGQALDVVSGTPGKSSEITAPIDIVLEDFDGDGRRDLIMACQGSKNIVVFPQMSDGLLGAGNEIFSSTNIIPVSLVAADLDGDLDVEVAFASLGNTPLGYVDGSTSATLVSGDELEDFTATSIAATDVDDDGVLDLVLSSAGERPALLVIRGTIVEPGNVGGGGYGLGRRREFPLSTSGSPVRVLALDLDGDGEADLVTVDRSSDDLTLFQGGR